jgi:hypothetical protein
MLRNGASCERRLAQNCLQCVSHGMTQKVWFVSPKGIDIFDSPAREAGVTIKPEVERSGTPGTARSSNAMLASPPTFNQSAIGNAFHGTIWFRKS